MVKSLTVQDGQVVSMTYSLYLDEELIDESKRGAPLEFIQGQGEIVPGLEQALYGMGVGESKKVQVESKNAYGDVDDSAFVYAPREHFPKDFPLKPGVDLKIKDREGNIVQARVHRVEKARVHLDLNHPLAGKDLQFNVQIVALRKATAEEISHGHVH